MLSISGICLGTRTVNKRRKDGTAYDVHYVGFQNEKTGGYDGEVVTTDVMITKNQFERGLMAKYENLRGQPLQAEIFVQPWQNGGGVTHILAGEGQPQPLKKG